MTLIKKKIMIQFEWEFKTAPGRVIIDDHEGAPELVQSRIKRDGRWINYQPDQTEKGRIMECYRNWVKYQIDKFMDQLPQPSYNF